MSDAGSDDELTAADDLVALHTAGDVDEFRRRLVLHPSGPTNRSDAFEPWCLFQHFHGDDPEGAPAKRRRVRDSAYYDSLNDLNDEPVIPDVADAVMNSMQMRETLSALRRDELSSGIWDSIAHRAGFVE